MTDRHLTRPALIEAARSQGVVAESHLESCPTCSDLVGLLQAFMVAGKLHLPDAPSGWVERAAALASPSNAAEKVRSFVARLVFDSWAMAKPLGVRGESVESDRRLRFETEALRLDLRAEKQSQGWTFVAQVKGSSESPIRIEADKQELLPDSAGIYQWSGSRPPRKITLRSDEFVIELPELLWKKPQAN